MVVFDMFGGDGDDIWSITPGSAVRRRRAGY
jgi:hypothetical protein